MKNEIIDSHSHLDDIKDLDAALSRAKEAGVAAIIAVGVNPGSNKKVLEICRLFRDTAAYPAIYPSLGIHPGDVNTPDLESAFKLIEENIEGIVAVGEVGLDYWYKEARKDGPARMLQEEIFLRQLDIASRYDKPVIIHSRGAWRECLEKAVKQKIRKAVFHWYSGPEDILREIIRCGYFISATPSCEYSKEHRMAVSIAPLDRIFIETDSPVIYKPESGNYSSEPRDVLRALKAVAEIKDVEEAEAARKTTENAIGFFDLRYD